METLAQMTEKERETCIGMWVNTPEGYGVLLDHLSMNGYYEPVVLIPSRVAVCDGIWDWDQLDLLPHLPRAWESDGTSPILISTAVDFLQKHPTPWELKELTEEDYGAGYEAIVDANGKEVIASVDAEEYQSWLWGEVAELIDWVNLLGGE